MSDHFELKKYSMQLNGLTLCIRSTQQSTKPVLYCIHGGPGLDSTSLIPGLLPLGQIFDLCFVDLRGHGESSAPADGDYSLAAYCDDIAALISEEHRARAVGILGHSFGGLVAIRLLAKRELPLDFGIVCAAPFDTGYQAEFGQAIESSTDPDLTKTQREYHAESATDEDFRKMEIGAWSIYFPELSRKEAIEFMGSWTYRVEPYRYGDSKILSDFDLSDELQKIQSPCLVIGGEKDVVISSRYLDRYKGLIRQGSVGVIEGAGHFPFFTVQDQFSKQVSQWWELNRTKMEGMKS